MTRKHWAAAVVAVAAVAVLVLINTRTTFKGVVLWNDGSSILVADLDSPSRRYLVDLSQAKLVRVESAAGVLPGSEVYIRPRPNAEVREETRFDREAGEMVQISWTAPAKAAKLTLKNEAELKLFGDAVYEYLQYLRLSGETQDAGMLTAMEQMLWEIENIEMYG